MNRIKVNRNIYGGDTVLVLERPEAEKKEDRSVVINLPSGLNKTSLIYAIIAIAKYENAWISGINPVEFVGIHMHWLLEDRTEYGYFIKGEWYSNKSEILGTPDVWKPIH
ncbi:hypothetical protein OsccyDRAFT_0653 [Leptolyngbyaceae cyanobacterium JSC-12]|nr:hypothetical protein OsccyDRAFT_0653 [Leptolyngbyaceae cyanobacterium JSC-12]